MAKVTKPKQPPITQTQLQNWMLKYMRVFAPKGFKVTEDTVHSEVLTTKGKPNPQQMYRDWVTWTLTNPDANTEDKQKGLRPWSRDWPTKSVKEWASHLLRPLLPLLLLLVGVSTSYGQLELSLGAVKTPNTKQQAISLGIVYAQSLDSIFRNSNYFLAGRNSSFSIMPEIRVQTGSVSDAFNSIEAKATGLLMAFKTTTMDGIVGVDVDKTVHTFPFSLGVESDNTFRRINGIVEAGWVPFYQSEARPGPDFIKRTKFGIYAQGGYMFYGDSSSANRKIFRGHGVAGIDTKKLLTIQGLNLGLVANADGWYDILRGQFYHKVVAAARIYLSETNFVDLEWQDGNNPPGFQEGEQIGINVKFIF